MRLCKRKRAGVILCPTLVLVIGYAFWSKTAFSPELEPSSEWTESDGTLYATWSQLRQLTTPHRDLIRLPDQHCPVARPAVLFFIRIPKCASTSFVELLQRLSKTGAFQLSFNPRGAFNWDESEKHRMARTFAVKNNWVHAEHFYHLDFRTFGLHNYTYVAIVREPVSRVISSYLYYHYSSKRHIQNMLNPLYKNESISDCLNNEHGGCEHNLMTKYFCGHEEFCKNGSRALLYAKQNILAQFAVVGVLERMDVTIKVLKAVLPWYFGSLEHTSYVPLANKNEHVMPVTAHVREAIMKVNELDLQLYEYTYNLLFERARVCDIT